MADTEPPNSRSDPTSHEVRASADETPAGSASDLARQLDEARRRVAELEAAMGSVADGLIVYGVGGEILRMNPAAADILGYSPDQSGIPFPERIAAMQVQHPADGPFAVDETPFARAVRDETVRGVEMLLHPGGRTVYVLTSAAPIKEQGTIRGVVATFTDVTDRRRAEESMRANEGMLRALVDNSPSYVYLKDLAGRYLLVNRRFGELFGDTPENLVGRSDFDILPADAARMIQTNDRRLVEVDSEIEFEETLPRPEGQHTYISAKFPVRDAAGRIFATGGISTDITERKQSQAERERLLGELDAVFEAVVDPISVYDRSGNVTRVNPALVAIFGFDPVGTDRETLIGRLALRHPDGRAAKVAELPSTRALLGRRVPGERFVMTNALGQEQWVSVGAAPLVVGGEVCGAVAIWHDTTERERLVQRIQRSAAQLDVTVGRLNGLIQDREAYIHTISHDLRAPLTVVLGQAGLALRSAERADLVRRSATAILTASRRMNVMIQDLVDSARLESGQLRLERAPVDLREFLREYIERSASVVPTERIRVQAPADLPRVFADPNRLERILTNLLSNAVKYSEADSEITITLDHHDDGIVASVTDRGRGVAPEVLPRLFERYFRAKDTSEHREGLGLGLFITRGLVEAHGGHIWVESTVGVGSTFRFTLPVCSDDRAREQARTVL